MWAGGGSGGRILGAELEVKVPRGQKQIIQRRGAGGEVVGTSPTKVEARTKGAGSGQESGSQSESLEVGGCRERFQTGCDQHQAVARSLLSGRS